VGYYGGVNYGFGYMGIGFAGGMWRGGVFAYNTAVMHVGIGGGWAHNTYEDRAIVDRNTVARGSRVAFSGGPGGINHPATAEERVAERDQHVGATSFQSQHLATARADHTSYAKANGGRPQNLAASRPLAAESHPAPATRGTPGVGPGARSNASFNAAHTTAHSSTRTSTITTKSYSTPRPGGASVAHTTTHTTTTGSRAGGGEPRGGGGGGKEHK
jgi:hypothetical protein